MILFFCKIKKANRLCFLLSLSLSEIDFYDKIRHLIFVFLLFGYLHIFLLFVKAHQCISATPDGVMGPHIISSTMIGLITCQSNHLQMLNALLPWYSQIKLIFIFIVMPLFWKKSFRTNKLKLACSNTCTIIHLAILSSEVCYRIQHSCGRLKECSWIWLVFQL